MKVWANELRELREERDAAKAELATEKLVVALALATLKVIANMDYRGPRPAEQTLAWQTLQDIAKVRETDGQA